MNQVDRLAELRHGQEADFFAQLFQKDLRLTRQGRPFYLLEFRDRSRNIAATIWEGSSHESACRDQWTVGHFYKIRGTFQETIHGGKIEIKLLRPVEQGDHESGFDPATCQPSSEADTQELFDRVLDLVDQEIDTPELHSLVTTILETNRERIETLPGALHHHHAYAGGFLEHIYSVTQNVLYLLNTYRGQHSSLREPITRQLTIAGALLHDIGKLAELDGEVANTAYTPEGELVGHIVLGRDLVRDTARDLGIELNSPWLLRLEHLVLSHQGTAANGSPKAPMTWEANLIYWADELDGNIFRLAKACQQQDDGTPFVPKSNPFGRRVYRGDLPSQPEDPS
ncbi:3'-5' exoribonuclease YhaM family protein [Bremerella sp. P1]|uniref:3'-5' exoribonuclease YhaM family protein n=1 Tax=Bremerella sp. P1 TaxID=3026424 RepID=UPI00236812BC|nr:HD domain-containing protein [Bremerella sp. P1]WDI43067.1 HD domain-containing protein [Bremerella sp. P1]